MQKGDSGKDVKLVQSFLNLLGYHLTPDGVFGSITEGVVRKFQLANNIFPSGVIDDNTLTILTQQAGGAPSSNLNTYIIFGALIVIGLLILNSQK
jgi:peptidoglycan hydrolase-like protein with peptidoglycan-binding domain